MTDEMSSTEAERFAEEMARATVPSEVADIIVEIEDEYDTVWKPLGKDEQNYSTVYNQPASPMPALVELITNAQDAEMLKFFDQNASDDIDPNTFASALEAVQEDWVDEDDAKIELIADGKKPTQGNILSLTVRDTGIGKAPDEFEDFVDTHEPGLKKQEYGFCQGQFGMGSTGVLPFCGEEEGDEYKFIASASAEQPGVWSWTVIRHNVEQQMFEYLTIDGDFPGFEGEFGDVYGEMVREAYQTDKYDIERNVDIPEDQSHGSFVKLYDYQTQCSRTQIGGSEGFRYKLERLVVNSPFEIWLTDTRYDSQKVPQTHTGGFLSHVRDGYDHLIKGEEHLTIETESDAIGQKDAHVIVFKDDEAAEEAKTSKRGKDRFVTGTTGSTGVQKDHAVMLSVNGQTHASKHQYFLKSAGYHKIADDTVVIVDFDEFADKNSMVKLFRPSRDSLRDNDHTDKFEEALEEALQNSDFLHEENERRRASRSTDEHEVDVESLEEIVQSREGMVEYLKTGEKTEIDHISPLDSTPTESTTEQGFTTDNNEQGNADRRPLLPTYLRPIKEYDPSGDHEYWDTKQGYMSVDLPVNDIAKIRFETDAQSDYLTRDVLSGDLSVFPSSFRKSVEIRDGILTLTVEAPDDADVGDDAALNLELSRPDPADCDAIDSPEAALPDDDSAAIADGGSVNTNPLTAAFRVSYTEPVEETQSNGPSVTIPEDDMDDKDDGAGTQDGGSENRDEGFVFPTINHTFEEEWRTDDEDNPIDEEDFEPKMSAQFDEHTVIAIEPSPDGTLSGLTFTINMDAAPLRRFIVEENVKETWKEAVEQHYEIAVVFAAMSQYHELKDQFEDRLEESEILVSEILEATTNGIGQTILQSTIPEDHLDRITE